MRSEGYKPLGFRCLRLPFGFNSDGFCSRPIFAVLQFLLVVSVGEHAEGGVRWIEKPGAIAKHYLRSWFFLDAASIGSQASHAFSRAFSHAFSFTPSLTFSALI